MNRRSHFVDTANGSNLARDWEQGYGHQFWRCRHNGYRGDGAFGQFCIVMPLQDAVVAITAGVGDMQAVLNLVWEKLLPAMKSDALPSDTATEARLAHTPQNLSLRPVPGEALPRKSSARPTRSRPIPRNWKRSPWKTIGPL